ncbi:MAG: hypothetical protein AB2821_17450 [Candidatus Thiodiazotropha endolucinida]
MGGEILATIVFVPGDLVVVLRGRDHIEVAVTVHVYRGHPRGAVGR